ncbi:MAG: DUF4405 domain-containing protein [Candidatus Micrarchaeota archaeon]
MGLARRYLINVSLGIAFLLVFITGIIKIPGLIRAVGLSYDAVPILAINTVHDWSGVAFGILAIIHIFVHRAWFIASTKTLTKKN